MCHHLKRMWHIQNSSVSALNIYNQIIKTKKEINMKFSGNARIKNNRTCCCCQSCKWQNIKEVIFKLKSEYCGIYMNSGVACCTLRKKKWVE